MSPTEIADAAPAADAADTILAYEDYRHEQPRVLDAHYGTGAETRIAWSYREWAEWCYERLQGAPAPAVPAGETPVWSAVVNAGRWTTRCPACRGGLIVSPADPVVICPLCPSPWATVEFPPERAELEQLLLQLPGRRLGAPTRNWVPGQTPDDIRALVERAERLVKAGADPTLLRALSVGATRNWVVGEILTAANENTYVSDILDDLAGRNGVIELEDSVTIASGSAGDRYLRVPSGATNQRPPHAAGRLRFNTTLSLPEISDGNSWKQTGDQPILTYETLNAANDVGTGSQQVARGNHTHLPGEPASPTLKLVTDDTKIGVTIVLPWPGSSRVTGGVLSYRTAGVGNWQTKTLSTRGTTWTLSGLTKDTSYEVRYAAKNSVGTGAWSPSTSITTKGPPGRPAAPTLNFVTDNTKIGVTVVLPSPGSSPVTGGVLSYRTTGVGNWQTKTLTTRGTTWTLSGLTKDTSYEVRYAAKNSVGTGPWSPSTRIWTKADVVAVTRVPGEPAAPTLKLVTDDTKIGVTIVLPWPGSSRVTGGVLSYRTTGVGNWQTKTLSTRGTTWTLSGLTKGTSYEVRYAAKNSVGTGAWSPSTSITTKGPPGRPAAPTLNFVTDSTKIGVTVVLPSPGSSPVTGGVLSYRTTGTGNWQTKTLTDAGTIWTLSGLVEVHEL